MKNQKKTIICLILVIIINSIIIYKITYKEKNVLNNITTKDEINNMDGLAIMLDQGDGTYKESDSKSFPTDMEFNSEKSGCIDNLGKVIPNSITFENGIVSVELEETSSCYLYFDKLFNLLKICNTYNNIDECVKNQNIENVDSIWKSNLNGDGYRYVGTNPNNYICFGTTDKTNCTNNTDKYMYRIIGIFNDDSGNNHLKLIKKEALNEDKTWHNVLNATVNWDESSLYNGLHKNDFMTNSEYKYMQEIFWPGIISNWKYISANTLSSTVYELHYLANSSKNVYLHEMNKPEKTNETCYAAYSVTPTIVDCNSGTWKEVNAKIGLMYANDYLLSMGEETLNLVNVNNKDKFKNGWINIYNNDIGGEEFVIAKESNSSSYIIQTNGYLSGYGFTGKAKVRPVFYLNSSVKLISGSGTLDNPFIIEKNILSGNFYEIKNTAGELLYTYNGRNYLKTNAGEAIYTTFIFNSGGTYWYGPLLIGRTKESVIYSTTGNYTSVEDDYSEFTYNGDTWYVSSTGALWGVSSSYVPSGPFLNNKVGNKFYDNVSKPAVEAAKDALNLIFAS